MEKWNGSTIVISSLTNYRPFLSPFRQIPSSGSLRSEVFPAVTGSSDVTEIVFAQTLFSAEPVTAGIRLRSRATPREVFVKFAN